MLEFSSLQVSDGDTHWIIFLKFLCRHGSIRAAMVATVYISLGSGYNQYEVCADCTIVLHQAAIKSQTTKVRT